MPPIIAFIGCDGAGKSTLVADLVIELGHDRSVRSFYLGLGSGTLGRRIGNLPVVGPMIRRRLESKGKRARTTGSRIPGLATALVIFSFSLTRLRRFRQMLALRRAGVTILTDRYPQIEVPGFYDGPGLSAASAGGAAVAYLAARERAFYVWMASHSPDIVIRLNIDFETATTRAIDHDPELLRRKIAVTPQLRFGGAPIVDINANLDYGVVKSEVLKAIKTVVGISATGGDPSRMADV